MLSQKSSFSLHNIMFPALSIYSSREDGLTILPNAYYSSDIEWNTLPDPAAAAQVK